MFLVANSGDGEFFCIKQKKMRLQKARGEVKWTQWETFVAPSSVGGAFAKFLLHLLRFQSISLCQNLFLHAAGFASAHSRSICFQIEGRERIAHMSGVFVDILSTQCKRKLDCTHKKRGADNRAHGKIPRSFLKGLGLGWTFFAKLALYLFNRLVRVNCEDNGKIRLCLRCGTETVGSIGYQQLRLG